MGRPRVELINGLGPRASRAHHFELLLREMTILALIKELKYFNRRYPINDVIGNQGFAREISLWIGSLRICVDACVVY